MGLRIDDAVRHWWDRHPWEGLSPVEVERAVTARVAELIEVEGEPMPGALAVIDLCRRPGHSRWPSARAPTPWSSRPPSTGSGITDAMSAWHSAEWEPLGKPHPGAYLSTAAKLGVDPTACLAFEDSFNGAISAKAARMRVVAVPEPAALDSPRWGFCDLVLDSLEAFDGAALESARPPGRDRVRGRGPCQVRGPGPGRSATTTSVRRVGRNIVSAMPTALRLPAGHRR